MFKCLAWICLLSVVVAGVSQTGASAQSDGLTAIDSRLSQFSPLSIRIDEKGFTVPETIAAGRTLVIQENTGREPSHIVIMRLPDELTDAQLATDLADVSTAPPAWFGQVTFLGNPDRAAGRGGRAFGVVNFTPGRYLVIDPQQHPAPFARFDAVAPLLASTNSGVQQPAAPVADVEARLVEQDVAISGAVPAGRQIWQISNAGATSQSLAILPVPTGATKHQIMEAFRTLKQGQDLWTSHLGPEWMDWYPDLVNGVGTMSPGGTIWAQFDLSAGTYAALTFDPSAPSLPRDMDSMIRIFAAV